MKRDIIFFILGVIAGIATTIWGASYQNKLDEENIAAAKFKLKPSVVVQLTEESDGTLFLEVKSTKKDSAAIKDVFFKFDIPGKFIEFKEVEKDTVVKYDVSSSFLAGQSGFGTLAETVHIHVQNLYPGGRLGINISFTPTKPGLMAGFKEILEQKPKLNSADFIIMPVMDLHDYSRLQYYWDFMGTTISELEYLDWTYLRYIQDDNENLTKTLPILSPKWSSLPKLYPDLDAVRKMEEKRKNW